MYTDIAPAIREDFRSGLFTKTKQKVKGQKRKKKKTGSLEKWIPKLYSEDEINWRELSAH